MRKRLAQLRETSSRASVPNTSSAPAADRETSASPPSPTETDEECERAALRKDEDAVNEEILKWKKLPRLSEEEVDSKDFDLIQYWQVCDSFCIFTIVRRR